MQQNMRKQFHPEVAQSPTPEARKRPNGAGTWELPSGTGVKLAFFIFRGESKKMTPWALFDLEMKFLVNYLETNGYPGTLFQKTLRLFLNKMCQPLKPAFVPKQIKYIKLPYLGRLSYSVRKQLR